MLVKPHGFAVNPRLMLLALAISLASCGKTDKPSIKVFATPDEASNALLAAANAGDQTAARAIFGQASI